MRSFSGVCFAMRRIGSPAEQIRQQRRLGHRSAAHRRRPRVPAKTVDPTLAPGPPRHAHSKLQLRRRAEALLDRWPFRRKLNVLVIAPILVVGALLGTGVYN